MVEYLRGLAQELEAGDTTIDGLALIVRDTGAKPGSAWLVQSDSAARRTNVELVRTLFECTDREAIEMEKGEDGVYQAKVH